MYVDNKEFLMEISMP